MYRNIGRVDGTCLGGNIGSGLITTLVVVFGNDLSSPGNSDNGLAVAVADEKGPMAAMNDPPK